MRRELGEGEKKSRGCKENKREGEKRMRGWGENEMVKRDGKRVGRE